MWLPILSTLLGIIAFLPINFYPAVFVFLVPLFIFFLREQKLWRLILGAAIFRLIFGLGTVYYTLEPIFWSSSLLIFIGLPISLWLVKKLPKFFHSSFVIRHLSFFALPFLWTFFDLLQARWSLIPTYIITAGNALGSSPFLGLAAWGGLTTLTFFTATVNALIATIVLNTLKSISVIPAKAEIQAWIPHQARDDNKKCIFYQILVLIILLLSAWQISQYLLRQNALMYNNLPYSLKIAAISTNANFDRAQFAKLKAELSNKQLDLIIFPEDIFSARTSLFDNQTKFFQNLAKELNTNIITVFDTFSDEKKYNSAILFEANGQIANSHNKNRLTFIGEYWPFGNWRLPLYDWLAKNNPRIKNYAVFDQRNAYARGDENILKIKGINFAAPICLEIQYPLDLKKYRASGARFIVNPTSNRWINRGGRHFLYLTNNLRKIEAVWLKLAIMSSGVKDLAGVILPNGQTQLADYETGLNNYEVFFGEIRY